MLLYSVVITLVAPLVATMLILRNIRGQERWPDLAERLGGGTQGTDTAKGAIWVHGASNGELTSARRLIEALGRTYPETALVVTANTLTGRTLVRAWRLPGVVARLAPIDYRWVLGRFLRGWDPSALIVLENELWPNRLLACRSRGIPVAVIGARMSGRSARHWAKVPGLAREILGAIGYLSAQDAGSAERFVRLGLSEDRLGPADTLKSGVAMPPPPADALAALAACFARAYTLLAASTHAGEEAMVLQAFLEARRTRPGLKLIVAPRHPGRGAEVAAALREAALPLAIRSAGEAPTPGTAIYLADTLGEMALWYAAAGMTFVGGSLIDKGGHTPFEPAAAGSAILHGPHVANFADAYRRLDADGGALETPDAAALTQAVARLGPAEQARMTRRAERILAEGSDPDALIAATLSALERLRRQP